METYIARVVLHGAKHDAQAYEDLHDTMATIGFKREIEGGNGGFWSMPSAMYVKKLRGTSTSAEQRDRIDKAIEDSTWTGRFAIFVAKTLVCAWQGMDEAT